MKPVTAKFRFASIKFKKVYKVGTSDYQLFAFDDILGKWVAKNAATITSN